MTESFDAPPPGAYTGPGAAEPTGQVPPAGSEPPPGSAPPPGSVPPPGSQPPPGGAFAARYGLIRPRQPRMLAGVTGALSRATTTDPILWRVLLVALAFLGGLGIVLYLALWLGTPADGDSASPVESLFGRGRSSTSPVLTVIVGVLTLMAFGGVTDNWHAAIVGALIVGLVIALSGRNRGGTVPPPAPVQPAWTPPAPSGTDSGTSAGYRPPFAPHGPYAVVPPVVAPVAPKRPREQSRLGSLIFSVGLIVLGGLGLADLAGASISSGSYLAGALITVGAGLVVGAWFGRARGMIALGIVLALVLASTGPADEWRRTRSSGGDITWQPSSVSDLDDRYEHQFGNATLDLRHLDFAGQDRELTVQIQGGEFTVRLPDDVDVTAIGYVKVGDVTLFSRNSGGVRINDFEVTDLGHDGAGGGRLRLNVRVTAGHAEVTR